MWAGARKTKPGFLVTLGKGTLFSGTSAPHSCAVTNIDHINWAVVQLFNLVLDRWRQKFKVILNDTANLRVSLDYMISCLLRKEAGY